MKILYFCVIIQSYKEGRSNEINKWLGLRTGGEGNLILEINKTDKIVGAGEEKWCTISLEIKNKHIDLSIAGEIITDYEIKEITNNLKKLLDNKIEQTIVFETLEPYFKFIFNEDNVRINVNFDSSNDYFSLYLDKFNIKQLAEYLSNI